MAQIHWRRISTTSLRGYPLKFQCYFYFFQITLASKNTKRTIGWREHATLPDLNIAVIEFKTDTGAKTSSLHALEIELYEQDHTPWVKFLSTERHNNKNQLIACQAPVVDMRSVTSSGGHTERRPVIKTRMRLGNIVQKIELTLSDRSEMRYKMLLGRRAMRKGLIVNPAATHLLGIPRSEPQ